jgi:hypothetical protein
MNDINSTDADDDVSEALDQLSDKILAFTERVRGLQKELEGSQPPCSSPVHAASGEGPHAPD